MRKLVVSLSLAVFLATGLLNAPAGASGGSEAPATSFPPRCC